MRTSVKSAVALIATAAITLALAGCGGDDTSGDSADPTNAAETTEAAATTDAAATDAAATEDATSTDEAAEGSSDSKACSLLDNGTISEITGSDFSQAVASDDGSGSCTWDNTATGGLSSVAVMLDTAGGVSYEENRSGAALIVEDVTDVSVDGADHAFTYMGGMVVAMDVDGQYVQVMFISFDSAITDTTICVQLASEVAHNM